MWRDCLKRIPTYLWNEEILYQINLEIYTNLYYECRIKYDTFTWGMMCICHAQIEASHKSCRHKSPSSAAQIGLSVELRPQATGCLHRRSTTAVLRLHAVFEIPSHDWWRSSNSYLRFCTFSHASRGTHNASAQLCDVLLRPLALFDNHKRSVAFNGTQWRFKCDYIYTINEIWHVHNGIEANYVYFGFIEWF